MTPIVRQEMVLRVGNGELSKVEVVEDSQLIIESQRQKWYNVSMKNWSVDAKFLSKYPKKYTLWKLEQLINFGLGKEKLSRIQLKKHLSKLNIDPQKRKYLKFLLNA